MEQMATGGGHSSLEEVLTTRVPSLTKHMFTEIEGCLGTSFDQLLLELMAKTGRKKNELPNKVTIIMKEYLQLQ